MPFRDVSINNRRPSADASGNSMIRAWHRDEDGRRTQAADWVVQLQADDITDDQAAAFDAWLSASEANVRAYDAALGVIQEVEASAPRIAYDLRLLPQTRPHFSGQGHARRGWLVAGGMAAAATIAIAVLPVSLLSPPPQTFTTAKGEKRTVSLADGTVVNLNAGTRMTVTLARHERRVSMPQGEAVFDVAADRSRPFLIAAGDRTVRVVGTRFDVRRRGDQLSVTVDRGVVEVRPNADAPGRAFRLHPGQKLDHLEGEAAATVRAVEPSDRPSDLPRPAAGRRGGRSQPAIFQADSAERPRVGRDTVLRRSRPRQSGCGYSTPRLARPAKGATLSGRNHASTQFGDEAMRGIRRHIHAGCRSARVLRWTVPARACQPG